MANGLHLFVLLREWSGQVMAKARDLLEKADRFLDLQDALREQQTFPKGSRNGLLGAARRLWSPWRSIVVRPAQGLAQPYSPDPDWSKLDWMIAQSMVAWGHYDADAVKRAILGRSPHVHTRKPGHLED